MHGVISQGPCHGESVQYVLYGAYGPVCWQLRDKLEMPHFRALGNLTVIRAICAPPCFEA